MFPIILEAILVQKIHDITEKTLLVEQIPNDLRKNGAPELQNFEHCGFAH